MKCVFKIIREREWGRGGGGGLIKCLVNFKKMLILLCTSLVNYVSKFVVKRDKMWKNRLVFKWNKFDSYLLIMNSVFMSFDRLSLTYSWLQLCCMVARFPAIGSTPSSSSSTSLSTWPWPTWPASAWPQVRLRRELLYFNNRLIFLLILMFQFKHKQIFLAWNC